MMRTGAERGGGRKRHQQLKCIPAACHVLSGYCATPSTTVAQVLIAGAFERRMVPPTRQMPVMDGPPSVIQRSAFPPPGCAELLS